MTRLVAPVNETQSYIPNTDLEPGFYLIDSEIVFVTQEAVPGGYRIDRGLGGTDLGPHAEGARILDTEDPSVYVSGSTPSLDDVLGISSGESIADALSNATSPSGENPFATIGDAGGGTSRWVDLGVIDVAARVGVGGGAVELIPFAEGEYISQVRFLRDGFVSIASTGTAILVFATPNSISGRDGNKFGIAYLNGTIGFGHDTTVDTPNMEHAGYGLQLGDGIPDASHGEYTNQVMDVGPLILEPWLSVAGTYQVLEAIAWSANTPLDDDAVVLAADGCYYYWTGPGSTGMSEPTWLGSGHLDETVNDGDGVWTQTNVGDPAPTDAAVHVIVELVTPAAP